MIERIALDIQPKEWDCGAEVVNPLIADIVADFEMEPEYTLTPQQALRQNTKAVTAQLEALKYSSRKKSYASQDQMTLLKKHKN